MIGFLRLVPVIGFMRLDTHDWIPEVEHAQLDS